ncbi:MAG: hypothetical protein ACR2NR_17705 [Solirubrobacteraceae bacterium]
MRVLIDTGYVVAGAVLGTAIYTDRIAAAPLDDEQLVASYRQRAWPGRSATRGTPSPTATSSC